MAMKLKFKKQQFQDDAVHAVVNVFEGQLRNSHSYLVDPGKITQLEIDETKYKIGWGNYPVILPDDVVLKNIQKIQRNNLIEPSKKLSERYNLTVEMETGTGKTYTYIKTIYELYKTYGWCKFIIIVPSVAIREGVKKSLEITREHFIDEYSDLEPIQYFVYDSNNVSDLKSFERSNTLQVMIINSQSFNSDDNLINKKRDIFDSRKPIDAIAKTNPIIIIDEPQAVEGEKTKLKLKSFNPLFVLRYSATPKEEYNLVYRLDALDAYNMKIVKKIEVKGIEEKEDAAPEAYVYLEKINLSDKNPTATIHHYVKTKGSGIISKRFANVTERYNIYDKSDKIEAYKDGFTVTNIDGRDKSITLGTTQKLYEGDVIGKPDEKILRRIQIRETINTHLEREHELFKKGIKVLSLFFIDEVAKYRTTDNTEKGECAQIFEEEYKDAVNELEYSLENGFDEGSYIEYLKSITAENTHAGYFAIDNKGKATNNSNKEIRTKAERDKAEARAYDLIMKNKEQLLDFKEPVRFIFSHSALKEGWDNPNVFQICTLKQSSSETRKRQEIGRGMRLCVNQQGIRMDDSTCDDDVHDINILTIIASESYDKFAKGLQADIRESIGNKMPTINDEFFINKTIIDNFGNKYTIDKITSIKIKHALIKHDYLNEEEMLTEQYFSDKNNGTLYFGESLKDISKGIETILDHIYGVMPEDSRSPKKVELKFSQSKYMKAEFQELWSRINRKSTYYVNFDTDELIAKSVDSINKNLIIVPPKFEIVHGEMKSGKSAESLSDGTAMQKTANGSHTVFVNDIFANKTKYDLVGKIADETGLRRKDAAKILMKISPEKFGMFKINPEEFILKTGKYINSEKVAEIVDHISYNALNDRYSQEIFSGKTIKGKLGVSAMEATRHLYNYVVYDSDNERRFAEELEAHDEVVVYVKLPQDFKVPTPLGTYNPDWAIAFKEGSVKHIYFVAETKGTTDKEDLRSVENGKIECAKKHFQAISDNNIKYHVVSSYDDMINLLNQ